MGCDISRQVAPGAGFCLWQGCHKQSSGKLSHGHPGRKTANQEMRACGSLVVYILWFEATLTMSMLTASSCGP